MTSLTIVVLLVTSAVFAQRPGYVSGPVGYPDLAPRFRDNSTPDPDLGNRLGESGTTPKVPVDARGDVDLVNRLNSWPRPNRPFWILNAEHIERQRNQQGSTTNAGSATNAGSTGNTGSTGNIGSTGGTGNNGNAGNAANTGATSIFNQPSPNLNSNNQQPNVEQRFGEGDSVNSIAGGRPKTSTRHEFFSGSLP